MKRPTRTLQEEVEHGIRAWILSGRYPQDAWLPSIAQLCKQFKVSDKTVKIALTRLKQEGMLKGVNGRGLQVCRRQKRVLLLSRRHVRPDWTNMSEEEAVVRAAVEGWHERIDVLGREPDSPLGPNIQLHLDAIRQADVVVTYGIQNEQYHLRLAELSKPVLAIDFCPQRAAVSSASHASFQAGYAAAQHLLDLGHQRIAFLGVSRRVTVRVPEPHTVAVPENDTELAEAGYRQALRDAGLTLPAGYIGKDVSSSAPEGLFRLVNQTPAPTGLLCWVSAGNFEVRQVLENAGWKIPENLSICQVANPIDPSTVAYLGTYVEYSLEPVLALAVRCIHQLLNDPNTAPEVNQVIPKLHIGNSTAPVQLVLK